MKKSLRLFALILVLVMSVTVLCSCNSLDELRSHHAKWTDENRLAVEYMGQKYVKYDGDSKIFDKLKFDGSFGFFPENFITENDVPVMLGRYFGYSFDISRDKKVIRVWNYFTIGELSEDEGIETDDIDGWNTDLYFVLESEKDEIIEEYSNLTGNANCFSYETFTDDEFKDVLCPEEITRILLATAASPKTDESETEGEVAEILNITRCNKQMTVAYMYGCLIQYDNGDVYLSLDTDSYESEIYKASPDDAKTLISFIQEATYGEETAIEGLTSI